jgi:signal transduction histidine kinase/ActR/RegA family two-component response regulator
MIVALVLTFRVIRQSEESNANVEHARHVLVELVAVEGSLADLIFSSGDQTINRAATTFAKHVEELSALTMDNASQQVRLTALRREVGEIVRHHPETRNTDATTRAQAVVPQSLSQLLRAIRGEELRLLQIRVAADARTAQRLRSVLLVAAAGAGSLLVWVFGLVLRDERRRRHTEAVLRRANEELDSRVSTRTAELDAALHREQALRLEAETSNRLKDEFLMTVSHELRTPLNVLLGWADMLRLGILAGDRQKRAVESIYENAKLQKQLIGDLLDTARILTGKLRIEPTLVNLDQLVEDAANVLLPAAEAKGLVLSVEADAGLDAFVGDAARLQQIVWNLISNAVKFTDAGSVRVTLGRDDERHEATIVVSDTGRGIGEEFLPFVFDRFRQERTGTTRPQGGLGLGLAIARQLVELHGGSIGVEHGADRRGAIFTVRLPLAHKLVVDPTGEAHATRVAREMPVLPGARVLIVDDDAGAREWTTAMLEHCGAKVDAVGSAAEARLALARASWDVFLVDIAMPGEDGYALIRDIRTAGWRQPAAALTAHARDIDRERLLDAGFDLHISKPVEARTLALAVASLLDGARISTTE